MLESSKKLSRGFLQDQLEEIFQKKSNDRPAVGDRISSAFIWVLFMNLSIVSFVISLSPRKKVVSLPSDFLLCDLDAIKAISSALEYLSNPQSLSFAFHFLVLMVVRR
jgi:hypothetical protein